MLADAPPEVMRFAEFSKDTTVAQGTSFDMGFNKSASGQCLISPSSSWNCHAWLIDMAPRSMFAGLFGGPGATPMRAVYDP